MILLALFVWKQYSYFLCLDFSFFYHLSGQGPFSASSTSKIEHDLWTSSALLHWLDSSLVLLCGKYSFVIAAPLECTL